MSDLAIFFCGVVVSGLCLAFLAVSVKELKRLGQEAEQRSRQ
jgi:hypothetical protein